jgi:NAD(P)-dependent dehydrogenase (short-subunit alcohol dehydrogenase family)
MGFGIRAGVQIRRRIIFPITLRLVHAYIHNNDIAAYASEWYNTVAIIFFILARKAKLYARGLYRYLQYKKPPGFCIRRFSGVGVIMKHSSIVLVTGANSGLGKAACIELARMGCHVVMLCRDKKRGGEALGEIRAKSGGGNVELMLCDLASFKCIETFAEEFMERYARLDALINNAGTLNSTRHETADGYELHFGVNHLGSFLLTQRLLPLLKSSAPSRIINISSVAHKWGRIHFDDINITKRYHALKGYSQSKLAALLCMYELAGRLAGTGVTINALDPGIVGTNIVLNRENGHGFFLSKCHKLLFKTPEAVAKTIAGLAMSPEYSGVTGKYFVHGKAVRSSKRSYDRDAARRVWKMSERMTGLSAAREKSVAGDTEEIIVGPDETGTGV